MVLVHVLPKLLTKKIILGSGKLQILLQILFNVRLASPRRSFALQSLVIIAMMLEDFHTHLGA